jgi:hypothetical protein
MISAYSMNRIIRKGDWLIGINRALKRVEILRCNGNPNQANHLEAVGYVKNVRKVPIEMQRIYQKVLETIGDRST